VICDGLQVNSEVREMSGFQQRSKYFWAAKKRREGGAATAARTKINSPAAAAAASAASSLSSQRSILTFFSKSKGQESSDHNEVDEEVATENGNPTKRRRVASTGGGQDAQDALLAFDVDAHVEEEEGAVVERAPLPLLLQNGFFDEGAAEGAGGQEASKLTPLEQQVTALKKV